MRRTGLAVVLALLAACSTSAPPASQVGWPAWEPARELPAEPPRADGRPGPDGGSILAPASLPIATGAPYRFSLGHCGLASPVDLDGSFWVALDGVTAAGAPLDLASDSEMINATTGTVIVIDEEARFRTDTGAIIRFARHDGELEFPGCD